MIDRRELRIGNIVTLNDNHRYVTILEVGECVPLVRVGLGCPNRDYIYSEFRGVHITPEILELCGFKRVSRDRYCNPEICMYNFGTDRVAFLYDPFEDMDSLGQEISFLHQLQNLHYAISSTELDVSKLIS